MSEFSVNPTPPPKTTGGHWRWEPPTPEELQRMLPQFQIERLIGRGGMGAVYKGIQMSLDRVVAIKVLPPAVEQQDVAFGERFKNEARLMGRLNHPAVVGVHDFGRTPEGQLYFVMEFVDGTDVQQMIAREGRLLPEHALAVTAHLCDALGYAHKQGIVHRDIKPSNVLIDQEGRVKVADFGLAKLTTGPINSGLTQTGMAVGTPDYVAPEMLQYGCEVDGRADLYAVGVMLHQMLTGDIPRGVFKMPSQKFANIDPRFDDIVRRALEHNRDDRYQTSHELRQDLDVILTTPLAVAGMPSSAALPKRVMQDEQTWARDSRPTLLRQTVVPAPRERSPGAPVQQRGPFFEPGLDTPPPKGASSLPYVLVVVALLAVGGWYVMHHANDVPDDPTPTKAADVQPPAGTDETAATMVRLAALEAEFERTLEQEVHTAYAERMAALGKTYLAAVERALEDATKAGLLDDTLALREEKQRFTADKTMPAVDPTGLSPAVGRLRATCRSAAKEHELQRDAASLPKYDSYLKALSDYEKELMAQGKSTEAAHVRAKSDAVTALRQARTPKVP